MRDSLRTTKSQCASLLFLVSLCLGQIGCCRTFDKDTRTENEEAGKWVTSFWTGPYDWQFVGQWKTVRPGKTSNAISLLRLTPIVKITSELAAEFTGDSAPLREGTAPYLLRGVGDPEGIFPLQLTIRPDGTVWVGGGANSKCPVAMTRRPVVAWLPKTPQQIYVTFSINRD